MEDGDIIKIITSTTKIEIFEETLEEMLLIVFESSDSLTGDFKHNTLMTYRTLRELLTAIKKRNKH
ncbi:MAG: hypothetical protein KGZ82_10680 [Bacteroidales bacterium]|nr:hypothetical protein [Bacteroidales bacterium]